MSFCVVIFPSELPDTYVGCCVEKYVVTQGKTLEDVHYGMESVLATHALFDVQDGREPFALMERAPRDIRAAFMRAEHKLDYECVPMEFPDMTPEVQEKAKSVRGPRHYRYTDHPPPPPDFNFRGPNGGRRIVA